MINPKPLNPKPLEPNMIGRIDHITAARSAPATRFGLPWVAPGTKTKALPWTEPPPPPPPQTLKTAKV